MDGAHAPRRSRIIRNNKNSYDFVNTKNDFKINRSDEERIQSSNLQKDGPIHKTDCLPAGPSSSKYESSKSQNQVNSRNQNFSSRNSLRSACLQHKEESNTLNNSSKSKMLDFVHSEQHIAYMSKIGLESSENYVLLNSCYSSCFVKEVGGFYYCLLCCKRERKQDGHTIDRHLESQNHINKLLDLRATLLNKTPDINSLHMNAVCQLLNRWYKENSLLDSDIDLRWIIVQEFNAVLQEINPECYCRVIGSLETGTSLQTSDINLELIHPNSKLFESDPRAKNSIHHKLIDPDAEYGRQFNNHTLHYDLIPNASDTLFKTAGAINQGFSSINSFTVMSNINDLNSKVPRLILRHEPTQVQLEVNCYAGISHRMSTLLRNYLYLDERARVLSTLVKYWAKLCNISDSDQGTYPPDTFIILVIYYLQRTDPPILPCLHERSAKGFKSDDVSHSNDNSITNEFEKLLVHDSDDKKGSNLPDIINFSDGTDLDSNENNLDHCIEAVEDEVEDEEDEDGNFADVDQEVIDNLNWVTSNHFTVYKLFIDFFQFMIKEFDNRATVISIRTLKTVSLSSKGWNTQVKAIENPIKPRINISRSIGSYRTFEFIKSCFKHCYYYLTSMPLDTNLKARTEPQADPTDFVDLYVNLKRLNFYFSMKERSMRSRWHDSISEMVQQNLFARDVETINELIGYGVGNNMDLADLAATVAKLYHKELLIPNDRVASTFCWLCRGFGHKRKLCPKAKLEKLGAESRSYDLDIKVNLDDALLQIYARDLITPEIGQQHKQVVDDLTQIIRSATGLDCKLQLFGSTVNYLGSCDSDLDICMTLEGNLTGKNVNCVEILRRVNEVLASVDRIREIEPILSARVPILKFVYYGFNVDLSMYNQCAIHNSELLKSYVMLDNRVAKLFYLVKRYAKACGIADASRGSLSSYAWSIMVIHFLQQINPPILPVLQETENKRTKKPEFGVNGWNVWFRKDLESITMPRNDLSLTQLFKQFFLYYGNFDFCQYVISIRTSRRISKFQKNWNNCMMAIEDPFELTYNLASRLDDPMAIYIINSFAGAYRHIVKFQETCLERKIFPFANIVERIFNGYAITGTNPPYRGCRSCHRIGHKFKDCPELEKTRRNRNWEQRRQGPSNRAKTRNT